MKNCESGRRLPFAGSVPARLVSGGVGYERGYRTGADRAAAAVRPGKRVDLDKVPALAEDRMALWREVSAADWLSADEKKALLGLT